ncbi:hypothetical protein CK503_09510 [Aliifodinibius salipaludis]|uniref:Uncharacterized protein n=1 Tax=Fodinibius salipaludis TaxID=2032627 RepID=A0A2A2GAM2_9BACT|nr:hypothetical protein [Aliifodinibius salipaludis]PAU93899.1 hypothetical protein CK503_09510 [Aliifodinibius salipaludis]
MRNEDNNDCIRYLMKEMDPSEELLMERAMMEDEDLLIEVESMRQTLKKLDQLPEVEPPSHVTDSIKKKAAEQAEKNRQRNKTFKPAFKYAVAATLALTISAGGAWLFIGGEDTNSTRQQAATTSVSSPSASQAQDIDQVSTGNTGSSSAQFAGSNVSSQPATTTPETSDIEPWIDREDILRFEDQFSNQQEQFQTILQRSTERLQLIQEPSIQNNRVKSIQLTGSGN